MKNARIIICLSGIALIISFCLSACGFHVDDISNSSQNPASDLSQSSEDQPDDAFSSTIETDNPDEIYDDITWKEDDIAAVCFVAGDSYFSDELNINTQLYLERYKFANSSVNNVQNDGCEYYYIVPRYPDCSIVIESIDFDSSSTGQLYSGNGSDGPVLLCANISDIIPNTRVTVTYGDASVSFSPSLSLKGDGDIMNSLPESINDITVSPLPATYGAPDENSWPEKLSAERPVINAVLEYFGSDADAYHKASPLDMLACVNNFIQYGALDSDTNPLYSSNGHYYVISSENAAQLIHSMWADFTGNVTPSENGDIIKYNPNTDEYSFPIRGVVTTKFYECYDFFERDSGHAVLMVRCWERDTSFDDASKPTELYVIELVRSDESNPLTSWCISDYRCVSAARQNIFSSDSIIGEWETIAQLGDSSETAVYHLSLNSDGTAEYYHGIYDGRISSIYSGSYYFDAQNFTLQLDMTLDNTTLEDEPSVISGCYLVDFSEDTSLLLKHITGDDITPAAYTGQTFAMADTQ